MDYGRNTAQTLLQDKEFIRRVAERLSRNGKPMEAFSDRISEALAHCLKGDGGMKKSLVQKLMVNSVSRKEIVSKLADALKDRF